MLTESLTLPLLGFIGLNFILLFNAGLISIWSSGFKLKNWGKFVLSIFILFSLQILLSQIALGIFGLLTYANIWIINSVFFIITLFLFRRYCPKKIIFPAPPQLDSYIFLIIGPIAALFLLRYFYAILQIPIEYDSISYHLPFVVEWFKTKSLLPIYYNAFAGPVGYYPSNVELFELWSFLPFGKDFFINFINFFMFPIIIFGSYGVLKNLKIRSVAAWTGIGFLMYMPIIPHFFGFPHVDVFFTVAFILAIYFLQEFWKTKFISDFVLSGIAIGLFVGTKYLGIPYALPLLIVAGVAVIKNFYKHKIKLLGAIAGFTGGGILGGGFWYIRNWLQSGNPIFPTEVVVAGHKLFSGYYGLTEKIFNFSLLYNIQDLSKFREFVHGFFQRVGLQSILIPVFLSILFIYLIFLLFKFFLARIKSEQKKEIIKDLSIGTIILFSAIFYFYFYLKAPYSYSTLIANVRYSMMFLFVASIMVGLLVDRLKIVELFMYAFFPAIAFYNIAFLVINNPEINVIEGYKIPLDYQLVVQNLYLFIIFSFWCALIATCIYLIIKVFTTKKSKNAFRFITVLSLIFFVITTLCLYTKALPKREELKNYFYEKYYTVEPLGTLSIAQVANWFDEHAPNAKIAYTGSPFHYHLFGRSLQREADYININECLNCRYFEYRQSPESIRRDPNFDNWLSNLKAKEKEYVVIATNITNGVRNWEFEWAKANPKNLESVFQKDSIYVYKIVY